MVQVRGAVPVLTTVPGFHDPCSSKWRTRGAFPSCSFRLPFGDPDSEIDELIDRDRASGDPGDSSTAGDRKRFMMQGRLSVASQASSWGFMSCRKNSRRAITSLMETQASQPVTSEGTSLAWMDQAETQTGDGSQPPQLGDCEDHRGSRSGSLAAWWPLWS